MQKVLVARKVGMTQLFTPEGNKIPVTILDAADVKVSRLVQNKETQHLEIGIGKRKKARKADLGNHKTLGFVPRFAVNVPVEGDAPEVGSDISVDTFNVGDKVIITGITKGKGYQGVVKRWGFSGGPKTHGGESGKHRSPGSIGPGQTVARIYKGTKMGGRMGGDRQTIRGLKVAFTDVKNKLIAISGSIPGPRGSYLVIKSI